MDRAHVRSGLVLGPVAEDVIDRMPPNALPGVGPEPKPPFEYHTDAFVEFSPDREMQDAAGWR